MSRLKLEPQQIDDTTWYYEENNGIHIMHEIIVDKVYLRTEEIVIPWKRLKQSLIRKGWIKQ